MKEWAIRILQFLGASLGVLVSAWVMGFSSSTTIYHLFKTERAEAEERFTSLLNDRESKIMSIRQADMDGLHRSIDLLARSQENMLRINQEILRRLPPRDVP